MLIHFFKNSFSLKNHPRISGTAFSVLFSVKGEFWPNPGQWGKQKDVAITVAAFSIVPQGHSGGVNGFACVFLSAVF